MAHPGGRPTIYGEEMLEKTQAYIDNCNDTEEDKELNLKKKVNLPTLEGLAYEIKVNKDTIQEWRKVHPEFSVLIGELLAKQARSLVNNGLSGSYNPTIAKVLLTKHGYREGIDATTNDLPLGDVSPETLAKAKAFEEWHKQQLKRD